MEPMATGKLHLMTIVVWLEKSIVAMDFWDEGQYATEEQWQEEVDVLAEEKGRRDTTAGAAQSWYTA